MSMNQQKTILDKKADTKYQLHDLISRRWSPRAFSSQPLDEDLIKEIFDAARWAPSASNNQPWRYVYAVRGTKGFDQLWSCLASGNQPWARNAAVLFVAMADSKIEGRDRKNAWAEHDLGMANAQLILQALSRDVYAHMMGGFSADKVSDLLDLDETVKPVCMGVMGYLGDPEDLEERNREREMAARSRRPLESILKKLD